MFFRKGDENVSDTGYLSTFRINSDSCHVINRKFIYYLVRRLIRKYKKEKDDLPIVFIDLEMTYLEQNITEIL